MLFVNVSFKKRFFENSSTKGRGGEPGGGHGEERAAADGRAAGYRVGKEDDPHTRITVALQRVLHRQHSDQPHPQPSLLHGLLVSCRYKRFATVDVAGRQPNGRRLCSSRCRPAFFRCRLCSSRCRSRRPSFFLVA